MITCGCLTTHRLARPAVSEGGVAGRLGIRACGAPSHRTRRLVKSEPRLTVTCQHVLAERGEAWDTHVELHAAVLDVPVTEVGPDGQ